MTPPPESTSPEPDPGTTVDDLLSEILDRLEVDGDSVVAEVCAREPELATEINRKLAILRKTGLLPQSSTDDEPGVSKGGVPDRLGEFRLLQRIGQGGMGVVHLAVQEPLNRQVAIKLVRPENLWFTGARERFQREVESVSRLAHPGILPVHTVGEEDGVPFLVMEYVEGLTLCDLLAMLHDRAPQDLSGADALRALLMARDARRVERSSTDASSAARRQESSARRGASDSTPVPDKPQGSRTTKRGETSQESGFDAGGERLFEGNWVQFCVRVAARVAEALSHAHATGILHRDVKPSNIFLTASGRVLLFDFGLAYPEGGERLTQSGARLGSLPYMAPEQLEPARGNPRGDSDGDEPRESEDPGLGPWTDVYGLGVTLFELLTLRCAHDAGGGEAIRRSILDGVVRSVRRLNPSVPVDAETVCLTAMERDPVRRYPSAAEFARDAENFLHRRSIQARPMGWTLRLRRWSERHPARATAAVLILGGLLLALVTVPALMTVAIAKERDEAVLARSEADDARAEAVSAQEREAELRAEAEAGRAREETLRLAERKNAARANLGVAEMAVRTGEAARLHEMLAGVPEDLRRFEWYRLSRRADAALLDVPLSADAWSSTTVAAHPFRPEALVIRAMPNDEQLRYELINLRTGEVQWTTELATNRHPWASYAEGGRLYTELHGVIRERNPKTGAVIRTLPELSDRAGLPQVSADGELLAWRNVQEVWRVISTSDGTVVWTGGKDSGYLSRFRGNVFFAARVDEDGLTMLRHDQPTPAHKIPLPRRAWGSLRPAGDFLTCLVDDVLQVYNFETGAPVSKLMLGVSPVALCSNPDGDKLLLLMAPRSFAVVSLESGRVERRFFLPDVVYAVIASWRQDGAVMIATPGRLRMVAGDESPGQWAFRERSVYSRAGALSGAGKGLVFSSDSSRLAFNLVDGSIRIIDVDSQVPYSPCVGHTTSVSAMTAAAATAEEPMGRFASASWDGTIRIWSFATGDCLRVLRFTDTSPVGFLRFTPDQQHIILVHGAGHGRVLSVATGEAVELQGVDHPNGKILTSGFNSKGQFLIRASNGYLSAWEPASGTLLGHTKQRDELVAAGLLEGEELLGVTQDSIPEIVQRSIEMGDQGHKRVQFGADRSVALSPCGERLLVASLGGSATLWDTTSSSPVYEVEHRVQMPMKVAFAEDGMRLAILGAPAQVSIASATQGAKPMEAFGMRMALARTRDQVDAAFDANIYESDVRTACLQEGLDPTDATAIECWLDSRRTEPRRWLDEAGGIAFSSRRKDEQYERARQLVLAYQKVKPDSLEAACLEGMLSVRIRDMPAGGAAFDRAAKLAQSQGIKELTATSLGHWAIYLDRKGDHELSSRLLAELRSRGEPSDRPPNVNATQFSILIDKALKRSR